MAQSTTRPRVVMTRLSDGAEVTARTNYSDLSMGTVDAGAQLLLQQIATSLLIQNKMLYYMAGSMGINLDNIDIDFQQEWDNK